MSRWRLEDPDELAPLSLFRFEWLLLSLFLDLWDPLEVVLDPDVSSSASLAETPRGELSSVVSLSDEDSLWLIGL